MKINQQAEIEELFKKLDKRFRESNMSKISDDELNRVRAYVVQSQRPLQSVRLLKKEQEERKTDELFTTQKEQIIVKARELDQKREEYRKEQQEMILDVGEKTKELQKNATNRKILEDKLALEQRDIEKKQSELKLKERDLADKEEELAQTENLLKQYKKFPDFLNSVVADKSGENFQDITDLQNRFKSLKNENNMLIRQKRSLQHQLDEAKMREKNNLNDLQNKLYEKQRNMQTLQSEIESLSGLNSILEQEYENEIGKKNKNSKELGQIINSINNINNICREHTAKVRKKAAGKDDQKLHEETPDLIPKLATKLDQAHQVVNELVEVYREYAIAYDYNRDKAYQIDIANYLAKESTNNSKNTGSRGGLGQNLRKTGQGASAFDHESLGQKTGKLPTTIISQSQATDKPEIDRN